MAQPTTRDASPHGPTAGPAATRAALRELRPDLLDAYDEALPGARAAILGRLHLALSREPLEIPRPDDARPAEARLVSDRQWPDATWHGGASSDRAWADGAWRDAAQPDRVRPPDPGPGRVRSLTTVPGEAWPGEAQARADGGWPDQALRDSGSSPRWARDHLRAAAGGITDPGELVRALWPGSGLAVEVDNSVANLALARAAAAGFAPVSADDGLAAVEQSVVDGHPLHPCCRTRGGMTVADVLAYAPEHRPAIHLRRLRVPADRWHGDSPPLLYAHPWQAERLRDEFGWLADDGPAGPVRPLMSLRTVAPVDGSAHLKTAVDVQMTSAVRTVSPAAVHNGPRLSALLRTLTADLPLTVLAEFGAGAVLLDGEPSRRLAHLWREAPVLAPGEVAVPLAATGVLGSAVRDPYRWLQDLSLILWPPLLAVLDRGVALEAHGQNTLVVLRDGRPVRILYRDLGGVRVSPARLRAAGIEAPPLLGDLPSDDPAELRTKVAAASVAVVADQLIAMLTGRFGADPARLWGIVAAAVRSAGTADAAAIATAPLPVKATTAMRLAADPLDDIWAHLDNPLAGAT